MKLFLIIVGALLTAFILCLLILGLCLRWLTRNVRGAMKQLGGVLEKRRPNVPPLRIKLRRTEGRGTPDQLTESVSWPMVGGSLRVSRRAVRVRNGRLRRCRSKSDTRVSLLFRRRHGRFARHRYSSYGLDAAARANATRVSHGRRVNGSHLAERKGHWPRTSSHATSVSPALG
ncbi:MAG TPA: hypothetical protein VNH11_27250 [Pirellulales bacterium]|nr:hypothetical protein [Pirellulales bacterium]